MDPRSPDLINYAITEVNGLLFANLVIGYTHDIVACFPDHFQFSIIQSTDFVLIIDAGKEQSIKALQ